MNHSAKNFSISVFCQLNGKINHANEVILCLLLFYLHFLQNLKGLGNDEIKTQIRIFADHKEEDAEELSHRYDNIRLEMEYP